MPSMTLTFTLPDEEAEAEAARYGMAYQNALHDVDDYLRGRLKYDSLSPKVREALDTTRARLREALTGLPWPY